MPNNVRNARNCKEKQRGVALENTSVFGIPYRTTEQPSGNLLLGVRAFAGRRTAKVGDVDVIPSQDFQLRMEAGAIPTSRSVGSMTPEYSLEEVRGCRPWNVETVCQVVIPDRLEGPAAAVFVLVVLQQA